MGETDSPRIRVATWPPWYAPNRYIELFQAALAPYGIEHVPGLALDAGEMGRNGVQVVHLHWAEWAWQSRSRMAWRRRSGVRTLEDFVAQLGALGITLVWTVHNLASHEGSGPVDNAGFAVLHDAAHLRIFHSQHARAEALERFGGAGDTLVMPHGNYDGVLPPARDRAEVRRELELGEDTRLLLIAGNLRAYKGIERAVAALDAGRHSCAYRLLVAGRGQPAQRRAIERVVRSNRKVSTEIGRLPDQRLADLHAAADVILLPYEEVTGSGALLMALTNGRGVVTSDLPYFREVLEPVPGAGEIARDNSTAALADAINRFFEVEPQERGSCARRLADTYAWDRVVGPVADWLRDHARTLARPPRGPGGGPC